MGKSEYAEHWLIPIRDYGQTNNWDFGLVPIPTTTNLDDRLPLQITLRIYGMDRFAIEIRSGSANCLCNRRIFALRTFVLF